jgi:hypothetical protein
MQGWPISRVHRAAWAFTLYGIGGRPFIHTLDTRHVSRCASRMGTHCSQ